MLRNADPLAVELRERIAAARRRNTLAAAARGAVTAVGSLLLLCALVLVLEAVFGFPPAGRTVLFWGTLSACVVVPLALIGAPLLRSFGVLPGESEETVALSMGNHVPGVGDRLLNLLSLERERTVMPPIYSVDLIHASFEDLAEVIHSLDAGMLIPPALLRRRVTMLGVVAAGVLLLVFLFPGPLSGALGRLFEYSSVYASPAPFTLEVEPGNAEVIKGTTVTVTIRAVGRAAGGVTLSSRPVGQTTFDDGQTAPAGPGVYRFVFRSLRSTTDYFARSGEVETEMYRLTVMDRPVLTRLRLTLTYPAYTGLGSHALDDNVGDVTALKGTTVRFTVEASKELSAAELVFGDDKVYPLNVRGRLAEGNHLLRREDTYMIRLRDTEGTAGADPITYTLRVVQDAFPTASVLVPGTNLDVADNTALSMIFRIADDYGFSGLRLGYRLVHSRYEEPREDTTFVTIPLPPGVRTEALIPFTWDLTALSLVPEDVVRYQIQVFDNDRISGPKNAFSDSYTLRLPSLEEVFANVDREHEKGQESLERALEKAVEARKELEELRRDLRADPRKLDWKEQTRGQELSRRYEEIKKELDQARQILQQMTEQMQQSRVLSEETLAKYQELQRVMEELDSPEFAEAMNRLQQSLQQISPEALRQALEHMQFSEEQFRKGIERTLQLLRRIQIEQNVDEAIRRAEELGRRQQELHERTGKAERQDQSERDALSKEQKDLAESLEGLESLLEDLSKRMQDFPREMPVAELDSARTKLGEQNPGERMKNAAQELLAGEQTEAMADQQAASQSLRKFADSMQQVRAALRRNQQQQIVNELRRASADLVELSRRQEDLRNEARGLEQNSARSREQAQQQMEMLRDLGGLAQRLGGLSQKTFSITPEIGKSLGDAVRSMQQAVQALDDRNGSTAVEHQTSSMASLNEAAGQVQGVLEAIKQGGGQGMGMAGFLQRLRQLSGMQQGINEATRSMQGMTQEQAAAMARLAGEQGMVRKSLEELAREASRVGELSKLLGDLNRIAQEMREVQTDLAEQDVSDRTLQAQDRILSRLLDSQRSMRERDFERRRRAETGRPVAGTPPLPIDPSSLEGRTRLRQDLLRALEQGYARDYEELIRKYFEALEQ
jgi:seryl-tRNA synthetase